MPARANLVLFSRPRSARLAVNALRSLARRGVLDLHVARVLRLRAAYAR